MKCTYSSKAVLNAVIFHKSHSFVHRLLQDMNVLNFTIFAEDIEECLLVADIPFERRDVKSIRRRVDSDRILFRESK